MQQLSVNLLDITNTKSSPEHVQERAKTDFGRSESNDFSNFYRDASKEQNQQFQSSRQRDAAGTSDQRTNKAEPNEAEPQKAEPSSEAPIKKESTEANPEAVNKSNNAKENSKTNNEAVAEESSVDLNQPKITKHIGEDEVSELNDFINQMINQRQMINSDADFVLDETPELSLSNLEKLKSLMLDGKNSEENGIKDEQSLLDELQQLLPNASEDKLRELAEKLDAIQQLLSQQTGIGGDFNADQLDQASQLLADFIREVVPVENSALSNPKLNQQFKLQDLEKLAERLKALTTMQNTSGELAKEQLNPDSQIELPELKQILGSIAGETSKQEGSNKLSIEKLLSEKLGDKSDSGLPVEKLNLLKQLAGGEGKALDTTISALASAVKEATDVSSKADDAEATQAIRLDTLAAQRASASGTELSNAVKNLGTPININKPEAQQALSERIQVMVTSKIQVADMRLDPPDLGSMQVRINMNGDQAAVSIVVQSQQAKDALDQAIPKLKDLLAQQGIELGESSIEQQSKQQKDTEEANGEGRLLADNELEEELENATVMTQRIVNGRIGGVDFYA